MNFRKNNLVSRSAVGTLLLLVTAALLMPAQTFAGAQGRGRHKKDSVFINGHDARDGRYDRRGPKRHKDRDDDIDDNDERKYRRRTRGDRDRDGISDRVEIQREAARYGYAEGLRAGRDDRAGNAEFEFRDENAYRHATAGYRDNYGDGDLYRRSFRQAFKAGYRDGYGSRSAGPGNIYFGRP